MGEETFIEQLTVEYSELVNRIAMLQLFMATPNYAKCTTYQQGLMCIQSNAMSAYAEVLWQRREDLERVSGEGKVG